MPTPTILFQPATGTGLGHVSRLIAIAVALRAHAPDARMLFATETGTQPLLPCYGLPHVPLIGEPELASERWQAWSQADRANVNLALAEALIAAARPTLVVFDCFPSRAIAIAAIQEGVPVAICVREMRDLAKYVEVVGPVLERAAVILVAHEHAERCVPAALWPRTRCVGAITRPAPVWPELVATEAGMWHVTITAGGGAYPESVSFFNRAMAAIARCREVQPALTATLATGPLFTGWRELRPVTGVRIVPFVPDLLSLFASSSLILCQGGYNTISEASCVSAPVICAPAEAPHDSQRRRALELAQQREDVRVLTDESEAELATWILDMLRPSGVRRPPRLPPGADLAARALLAVCDPRRPLPMPAAEELTSAHRS
jgi:predicted glycosyltransferase